MLGSVAASAETIKLGTLAPDGSSWHRILRDMAEAWKSVSNGEVELRIYVGGVIGDEPEEPPDWRAVKAAAVGVLERTRDLRAVVFLMRTAIALPILVVIAHWINN